MKSRLSWIALIASLCLIASTQAQTSAGVSVAAPAATPSPPLDGRAIFTDEKKGNCAACHRIPNDTAITSQSNLGPALSGVKTRYPDREKLRAIIWDLSKTKPGTIMPPYGKNRILTDVEMDALIQYLELV